MSEELYETHAHSGTNVQIKHMKHRCYFISTMCGMSLYSWYNYSIFDPINNHFLTPYYQNCILMLIYLGWDTYHMIRTPILFRTDLMIHHFVTTFLFLCFINNSALHMSHGMIMECISIMNYIWRDNPQALKLYRTLCIILIRTPFSLFTGLYVNPNITLPYCKLTRTHNHCVYLSTVANLYLFFIAYDVFILWKLYKPIKLKN
jgi:hypothetical protein